MPGIVEDPPPAKRELTAEQLAICNTCCPPANTKPGPLVRVTAAAGAGKTTVLLELATRAAKLGHKHISYVTFSKAAAQDGKQRLEKRFAELGVHGVTIDAMTLHSCAQRALKEHYQQSWCLPKEEQGEAELFLKNNILSDKQIEKWIEKECQQDLDDFLAQCYHEIEKRTPKPTKEGKSLEDWEKAKRCRQNRARQKAIYFIVKTLDKQFCCKQMTIAQFEDRDNDERRYYPAKDFHLIPKKTKSRPNPTAQGEKFGFTHKRYQDEKIGDWYADQACKLWRKSATQGIRSFAFEMKRAQLKKLNIPGSVLLVDEAQDMDESQVSWVADTQAKAFGTLVYVVGDAAQSIYSFRGAKSRYLMGIDAKLDLKLTASWRFGREIASIANVVLFTKEHSVQSKPTHNYKTRKWHFKYWIPYRVQVGNASLVGEIYRYSLLPDWKRIGPITVLARTNAKLVEVVFFQFLLDLDPNEFGLDDEKEYEMGDSHSPVAISQSQESISHNNYPGAFVVEEPVEPEDEKVESKKAVRRYPSCLPKFHINSGATAGATRFKKIFQIVEALLELYDSQDKAHKLPKLLFPEFEDMVVTWEGFCEECKEFEYRKYDVAVGIIIKFGNQTMIVMQKFQAFVLDWNFHAEEADVILSTVHASKGVEWDNVEVCDDFNRLAVYDKQGKIYQKSYQESFKKIRDDCWQFSISEFNDAVNLLYVAVTRAKKRLSAPDAVMQVVGNMDSVHEWVLKKASDVPDHGLCDLGSAVPPRLDCAALTVKEVPAFYKELVLPFREEHKIADEAAPTTPHTDETTMHHESSAQTPAEEADASSKKTPVVHAVTPGNEKKWIKRAPSSDMLKRPNYSKAKISNPREPKLTPGTERLFELIRLQIGSSKKRKRQEAGSKTGGSNQKNALAPRRLRMDDEADHDKKPPAKTQRAGKEPNSEKQQAADSRPTEPVPEVAHARGKSSTPPLRKSVAEIRRAMNAASNARHGGSRNTTAAKGGTPKKNSNKTGNQNPAAAKGGTPKKKSNQKTIDHFFKPKKKE